MYKKYVPDEFGTVNLRKRPSKTHNVPHKYDKPVDINRNKIMDIRKFMRFILMECEQKFTEKVQSQETNVLHLKMTVDDEDLKKL